MIRLIPRCVHVVTCCSIGNSGVSESCQAFGQKERGRREPSLLRRASVRKERERRKLDVNCKALVGVRRCAGCEERDGENGRPAARAELEIRSRDRAKLSAEQRRSAHLSRLTSTAGQPARRRWTHTR